VSSFSEINKLNSSKGLSIYSKSIDCDARNEVHQWGYPSRRVMELSTADTNACTVNKGV
jgi:hypothetical protein